MGLAWPQALIVAVFLAVPGTLLLRRASSAAERAGIPTRTTNPRVAPKARAAIELAAASGGVLAGARIALVGVTAVDVVITLVWIVAVINAFALLDRSDGVVAGIGAVAALGVLILAIGGNQQQTAAAAAALFGACLGFIACRGDPSLNLLGDGGRRCLGFTLALLASDVEPLLAPPVGVAVPLMLLALPILSTVVVSLGRLRRARSIWVDRTDHLYHRLRASGLSRRVASMVLVLVQVVLTGLAVVAGRKVASHWAALAAGFAVLAVLTVVCARAKLQRAPAVGWPRWFKRTMAAGVIGLAVVTGPAVVALARAAGPARAGADLATEALASASRAQGEPAAQRFERARGLFRQARSRLDSPLVSLGLAVPGLSSNVEASRTLVAIGERLSTAGARVATMSEARQLRVAGGSISVGELRRLTPALADAARVLHSSQDRLTSAHWHYLLPSLQRAVDGLTARLERDTRVAQLAADSASLLPAMLGAEGTRRYFLAFQNNAELRGSGGFIGNWGELVADAGRLRLERFGRLDELIAGAGSRRRVVDAPPELLDRYKGFDVTGSWQQVNVSPDFVTTARVIRDLYPQSGGRPVDGVIAVDPQGLAALLELTGPVQVPGWPDPVTAANVVDVTLRAAYERYPRQEERVEFLGAVARRVWEAFTTADLGNPEVIARSLGRATRSKRLMAHSEHPREQGLISRLGADGSLPPLSGDFLMAVNQNIAANKIDLYLQRRLRYHALVDPSSEPARVSGRLEVALQNGAPSRGLPSGVIGPYDNRFAAGENRTYLSLYSPFTSRSASLEGRPVHLDSQSELGRLAHSATVSVPALSSRTVQLELDGRVHLDEGNWYRLDLGHQPLVIPDSVEVSVAVPEGWRIAETRGLQRTGSRQASSQLVLDEGRSLWVRVERTGWSGFRHRLLGR